MPPPQPTSIQFKPSRRLTPIFSFFEILVAFCYINSILTFDILCKAEKGPDIFHHWLLNEENCSISLLSTVLVIMNLILLI